MRIEQLLHREEWTALSFPDVEIQILEVHDPDWQAYHTSFVMKWPTINVGWKGGLKQDNPSSLPLYLST